MRLQSLNTNYGGLLHSSMLIFAVHSQLLMCGNSNILFYFCRSKLDHWLAYIPLIDLSICNAALCKCGRAVRIEGHQERPEIAPMTETNLWPLITVVKGHCSLISGSTILSLTHLDLPKLSLWPFGLIWFRNWCLRLSIYSFYWGNELAHC